MYIDLWAQERPKGQGLHRAVKSVILNGSDPYLASRLCIFVSLGLKILDASRVVVSVYSLQTCSPPVLPWAGGGVISTSLASLGQIPFIGKASGLD